MVTIGVIAGIIVAVGAIITGIIRVEKWIFDRGRQAERESIYMEKIATELEDIKKRLPDAKSE